MYVNNSGDYANYEHIRPLIDESTMTKNKSHNDTEQAFLNESAHQMGAYPSVRPRRLRSTGWIRDMVAEHHVTTNDVVWPLFIIEGQSQKEDVPSMPGVTRQSIDVTIENLKPAVDMGLKAVAIFPVVPEQKKTMDGKEALNAENLICRTTHSIKKAFPDLGVITDVALDPYTTHGHDGIVAAGKILNDETIDILANQALLQAQAGADVIAPSDMMDGRVQKIRQMLESKAFDDTMIMSYAAKYASNFYGPFRDAVNSSGFLTGDKKTYQMDSANTDEALKEVAMDIQEGADMLMIKPGLPYLDIIARVTEHFKMPTFAYHVSGEYAMLKAASEKGWLNYEATLIETLLSFKRAGACGIFTYSAYDCLKILDKAAKNRAPS